MAKTSLERAPFARAAGARPGPKALRRATLLIGTALLLPAAPSWAINECGPPSSGRVVCPAGVYPNGISYSSGSDLEVLLEPGVVAGPSRMTQFGGDASFIGPVNTILTGTGSDALRLLSTEIAFANVDDLRTTGDFADGADIVGRSGGILYADTIVTTGNSSRGALVRQETVNAISPVGPAAGAHARINSITTSGFGSGGLEIVAIFGDVSAEIGSVSTSGGSSTGIESLSGIFSPTITIKSGIVTTKGSDSPGIRMFGAVATLDSGIVSTAGNSSTGILVSASQDITITSGSVSTMGSQSTGLNVRSTRGNVMIVSGTVSTLGGGPGFSPGILARTTTTGNVTVRSERVTTNNVESAGIAASTRDGNVAITSGSVETGGPTSAAIQATVSGQGNVSVTSNRIVTRSTVSPGIAASAAAGSTSVANTGTVETGGGNSPGIQASGTSVKIDSASITTLSNFSRGIDAASPGNIVIASSAVRTGGDRSEGIAAISTSGAVTVNSGTILTGGRNSAGILAFSTFGPVGITSSSIVANGWSIGLDASTATGDVNVISGSVVTQGGGTNFREGAGIYAHSNGGNISVRSGSVTTNGTQAFGILATSAGNVTVVSDTIATTGRLANAIFAVAQDSGSIAVTAGPMSTLGDSATGVVTFVSGPGTTSIRTGSISTRGFDSYGVIATSIGTGAIDVTGDGTIVTTGASSPGISAESRGAVTVSANNISTTGANSDAIAVKGSTSTVTVRGVVQSSQGFAIRGEGGLRQDSGPGGPVTATILAGGTLRGRVSLTGNADRINNNGTFDAIATSQFGAGADLFDNNAGATVQSVNGAATFAGLETFSNRGTIEMRDDAANDSLTLPGAYAGAGGARLGLDVDFAAGTADRLVTGAATGGTLIDIRGTGGDFTSGILLVDAGTGTSPTAFSLAPGGDSAYLRRDLRFDAANNDFLLVQEPGQGVFETARFGAMASQLWYESADAVAAQLDTQRDGRRGRGPALWLQGWTGERERSSVQTFGTGTFDVSFEQDFQGLQGGLDFQSGSAVIGIAGGTGRSDAAFVSGSPVDLKVSNVGLYAQVHAGPLFFNALAKRDWAEVEIDPGPGLGAEFDADLFGVQLNAGLRFDLGAVFAEPSVGLSWVNGDLDSFESGPATVTPGGVDSMRARAGLRVGAKLPFGGGTLLPFAAVNVYEELDDGSTTDFTLGETLRLFDEPAGTRGQAAAGISFVSAGFEAFVRGEMDFSGGEDAKAVRAGARLRF